MLNPEHKAKISAKLTALWANPEYRARCCAAIKKAKEGPMKASTKRLIGEAQKRHWADPTWREWQLARRSAKYAQLTPEQQAAWVARSRVAMQAYWETASPKKAAQHKAKLAKNMSTLVQCPVCQLWGGKAIMHRWHFDNCVPGRKTRKKKQQGL